MTPMGAGQPRDDTVGVPVNRVLTRRGAGQPRDDMGGRRPPTR